MFKQYEAGSKCWTEIGNLSPREKVSLMKTMENDILTNIKVYQDEYFHWLAVSYEEKRSDAKNFKDFWKSSYYIDKLDWLRRKNLELENKQRFYTAVDKLTGKVPTELINEILDTYEELTGLM